jgi:hypothetical protein
MSIKGEFDGLMDSVEEGSRDASASTPQLGQESLDSFQMSSYPFVSMAHTVLSESIEDQHGLIDYPFAITDPLELDAASHISSTAVETTIIESATLQLEPSRHITVDAKHYFQNEAAPASSLQEVVMKYAPVDTAKILEAHIELEACYAAHTIAHQSTVVALDPTLRNLVIQLPHALSGMSVTMRRNNGVLAGNCAPTWSNISRYCSLPKNQALDTVPMDKLTSLGGKNKRGGCLNSGLLFRIVHAAWESVRSRKSDAQDLVNVAFNTVRYLDISRFDTAIAPTVMHFLQKYISECVDPQFDADPQSYKRLSIAAECVAYRTIRM